MENKTQGPQTTVSIQNLTIEYQAVRGYVQAVRNVSLEIYRSEALALIGESGSGKTTIGLGLVRLLPSTAQVRQGKVLFRRYDPETQALTEEFDVLKLSEREMREFRWKDCAMVFQAALNAFNPVLKICDQFADTARAHGYLQGEALKKRAAELFDLVRLDPERVWNSYPHELSGGMRQRVLIALGLLLDPPLLILDEPTTALDILTQRNIMDVLKDLRGKLRFSLVFISHDLSLAAELADRIATVYAGRVVELGNVYDTFQNPRHPYTIGLMKAVPTLTTHRDNVASIPGSPPDLINMPTGCKFHPRCPLVIEKCVKEEPDLVPTSSPEHMAACWRWMEAKQALMANPR